MTVTQDRAERFARGKEVLDAIDGEVGQKVMTRWPMWPPNWVTKSSLGRSATCTRGPNSNPASVNSSHLGY